MTPDQLLDHPTKVVSPGNPNYSETPRLRVLLGDVRFQQADVYRAVMFTVLPVLSQILAAVTDGDLDQAAVLERIDTSVHEATRSAIEGTVLPMLREVLDDVTDDDNAELAEEILNKMGGRLRLVASDSEAVA